MAICIIKMVNYPWIVHSDIHLCEIIPVHAYPGKCQKSLMGNFCVPRGIPFDPVYEAFFSQTSLYNCLPDDCKTLTIHFQNCCYKRSFKLYQPLACP